MHTNNPNKTRYIFVTGGVVSSLGKGVAAASLGALLQSRGYTVHSRKFDPYLNVDPGTMSPHQHGEVYVTNDGHETDLDLGYYERFLGIQMTRNDSISGGRIYWNVLNNERRGDYLGKTIQTIPHITDEIQRFIGNSAGTDFIICEIGGTVGDIEGQVFLEAARQFANKIGRKNVMFVHLTLAPYIKAADELKTKPTQQSTRELLEKGIQADMLVIRTPRILTDDEREKIALFCNLSSKNVISGVDVHNIYEIPLRYDEQNVFECMADHFGLEKQAGDLSKFIHIQNYLNTEKQSINIAVCGKYFDVADSYKSLVESIFHAGIINNVNVDVKKIDTEILENMSPAQIAETFNGISGILVPGGFGNRGVLGKILVAKFARENNIPYLGICLGMQIAVIEFMRNVVGILDANSTEFTDACTPVITIMESHNKDNFGGTLRLGAYSCDITPNTLAAKIYGNKTSISERHRHRFEMDIRFENELSKHGMIISGKSPDGTLPEIVEIKNHPFFIAGQFHPEFQSSPYTSHPLFRAFIRAAMESL